MIEKHKTVWVAENAVLTGDIIQMPGLPRHPAALDIDVDDDGVISGLF